MRSWKEFPGGGRGGGGANLDWSPDSNLIVHKVVGRQTECEPEFVRQKEVNIKFFW